MLDIKNVKIEDMIYVIRGKQVIFDLDLAKLYECKNGTKDINKAVKRNINRFPDDFYFQLTDEEVLDLRFHFGTLNKSGNYRGQHIKYNPHVFTEQGVAMLASVLKTEIATQTSVNIMRAFAVMRRYISVNLMEQKYINNLVIKNSKKFDLIENALSGFKEKNNHLFFKGQIYDAYSLLIDILNKAKEEIIIIDNYIDKNILDILKEINKNIILITNEYNNHDYNKYKEQYHNINLVINNNFHDRFIIIDWSDLYHCGASFKDLGNKCFEISHIIDNDVILCLVNAIKKQIIK